MNSLGSNQSYFGVLSQLTADKATKVLVMPSPTPEMLLHMMSQKLLAQSWGFCPPLVDPRLLALNQLTGLSTNYPVCNNVNTQYGVSNDVLAKIRLSTTPNSLSAVAPQTSLLVTQKVCNTQNEGLVVHSPSDSESDTSKGESAKSLIPLNQTSKKM